MSRMTQAKMQTKMQTKKLVVERLPRDRIDSLLELPQCQNSDEKYSCMNPREYLADRMRILSEFGVTGNTLLSVMCGFSSGMIYGISKEKATRRTDGSLPMPSQNQAIRLFIATHGFIHLKYLHPEFWDAYKQIARILNQSPKNLVS